MALCFLLIVFEFPLRKLCASANLQGLRYPWGNCNLCSMKHIPGLLPVKPPQRLTREPTRQYLEASGAACKREASCFCSRLWDHTIHGLSGWYPFLSTHPSETIGKWAMISGPETDINFWPHNKNTAIFKTERSFQSVRTASTYDFFVSYRHIEGLKGPTTSAFSVGAVILVSCPFWATLA